MRHNKVLKQSVLARRPRAIVATSEQQRLMRGVVNGLILSLPVWLAVGYLTVILH